VLDELLELLVEPDDDSVGAGVLVEPSDPVPVVVPPVVVPLPRTVPPRLVW
jgi:hypothetical protein